MTAVAAYVATQETTTATTYSDLTTTTDTVTATIGASGMALVCIYAGLTNSAASTINYVGYALSGANTRAADDTHAIWSYIVQASGVGSWVGASFLETGLTSGSTTFKMKYRISGGSTGYFQYRRIAVIPIEDLHTSSTAVTAYVATSENATSTTYADLTTTTDTVTATIGSSGNALVCIYSYLAVNASGYLGYASYALSGANTRAADDPHAIALEVGTNFLAGDWSGVFLETGLTSGSTTFKMKYRVSPNGGTATFQYRRIAVIPL